MTSNFVRVEGNSLIFKTVPAVGILSLIGFTDNAGSTDPSGNSTFVKSFRYSLDGVNYSEWLPLTVQNLHNIVVEDKHIFIAEIAYFKQQPLGANYLTVSDINFTTESGNNSYQTSYFNYSLFSKYFNVNDADVLNWCINVLEKLYDKGLVPNYIHRRGDNGSGDDFIALFTSVAKFFAFYVKYARVFAHFYEYQDILQDFIEQRGLNTGEATLEELQDILETYYYQMNLRGQRRSVDWVDEVNDKAPEVYRLIRKQDSDYYLFHQYKKHHVGWNINNSSPLFRGLPPSYVYKNEEIGTSTNVTTTDDTYHLQAGSFTTKQVEVDDSLDFAFTFLVKATTGLLNISVTTYDKDDQPIDVKIRNTGDLLIGGQLLHNGILSRNDKYILVRVFAYNSQRPKYINDTLNIRQGNNIILRPGAKKIQFTVSSAGELYVKDIKFFPAYTFYSRGLVQVNNFVSIWLKNRNYNYTIRQLRDYIARYLVPYNTNIHLTNVGDLFYTETPQDIDEFQWIGGDGYCRKVVWIGTDPSCVITNLIWVPEEETAVCEQIQY